ncbi:MAG: hypothetical protein AAF558_13100 [Verrucomicrobiota bacterium]
MQIQQILLSPCEWFNVPIANMKMESFILEQVQPLDDECIRLLPGIPIDQARFLGDEPTLDIRYQGHNLRKGIAFTVSQPSDNGEDTHLGVVISPPSSRLKFPVNAEILFKLIDPPEL